MSGLTSAQRARAILLAALPDLAQLEIPYRVTLAAPDPELVDALVDHVRTGQPDLRAAAAAGILEQVAGIAHGLKGMGGAVGLPEISAAGAVLEQAARASQAAEVDRLVSALDAWVAACGGAA